MSDAVEAIERLADGRRRILEEIGKVLVGQDTVIDELLMSLFAGGNVLLVGVPGLAKTLMISSLSRVLDLEFSRIQFTPDLMPSDITGTDILEDDQSTGKRHFKFIKGPIFANVVLADEINRTPPKTQAALLQAMQEREVTAGSTTYALEPPFFVLATQNPIEMEGTYPLPEAQLDRFMFNIRVGYPSAAEEREIVRRTTGGESAELEKVLTAKDIVEYQSLVRKVPAPDEALEYAVALVRATRPAESTHEFIKSYISWGAGPRASQNLVLGGKARAALRGTTAVSADDIRAVAPAVLRHRLVTNFNADAEGVSRDEVISRLVEAVPSEPVGT